MNNLVIEFTNFNSHNLYIKHLHKEFKKDFLSKEEYFLNKRLFIRVNPKKNNLEHTFLHLITKSKNNPLDVNDRVLELDRAKRIKFNKVIIDTYNIDKEIFYYEHIYKGKVRINLVTLSNRFKVILEKRENYYVLITGYYLLYNHILRKEIKKISDYKMQKTPVN